MENNFIKNYCQPQNFWFAVKCLLRCLRYGHPAIIVRANNADCFYSKDFNPKAKRVWTVVKDGKVRTWQKIFFKFFAIMRWIPRISTLYIGEYVVITVVVGGIPYGYMKSFRFRR